MSERIMSYWPDFYRGIRDFVELAEAEGAELDDLEAAVRRLLDDQFVATSGEETVKRRERMLGIQADPSKESLDFRRKRLVNRYSTRPPFTLRYLQKQLDALVGPGMAVVSVDAQNFILSVTADIENADVFREVVHTVETVKPAHLIYRQNTSLKSEIGLRERIVLRPIAWNYALGSWLLGASPFATLGEEAPVA